MSTTIKFLNSNNNLITEQQANQMNDFSKHFFENDVLKKQEIYFDKELFGGDYYLFSGENLNNVLTQLDLSLKWSIMSNKQEVNGYTIWESKNYFENFQQKPKYSKMVLDSQGNHIAVIDYDSVTNESKGAFKVYYYGGKPIPWSESGEIFPEDSEICFSFSDDGIIRSIRMNYDIINNESYWTNLSKFLADAEYFIQEMNITPAQINYFTHSEPLIPNF